MDREPENNELEAFGAGEPSDRRHRVLILAMLIAAAVCLFMALVTGSSDAHEAPSGWSYPFACCSTNDCRSVPADWVQEQPDGFRIVITGEELAYQDNRIRFSPDNEWHWCSIARANDSRTICLFVPPRSY